MMSFSPTPLLLLGSALLTSGCSLLLALRVRHLKHELNCCRNQLSQSKATETVAATAEKDPATDFSGSLLQATLKQRLQGRPDWRQAPEKYRYAAALAEQEMDAHGIASVLRIPLEEAQQLIALKRAAQANNNGLANAKSTK